MVDRAERTAPAFVHWLAATTQIALSDRREDGGVPYNARRQGQGRAGILGARRCRPCDRPSRAMLIWDTGSGRLVAHAVVSSCCTRKTDTAAADPSLDWMYGHDA
jgi:hypothetical protein